MSRRLTLVVACIAVLIGLAACTPRDDDDDADAPPTAPPTAPANVEKHESGPESPIGFGLKVPSGATQLGPLVRWRSERLIAAYQPQLDAAIAQREAALQEKRQKAIDNGETPAPATPTPTESNKPKDDTFKLLDEPPKPDSTVSLMRIDGDPSDVTKDIVGQIASVLPDAGIDKDAWASFCTVRDERVTRCAVDVTGLSKKDRELHITMSINPGNVKTRTAPVAAGLKPVMVLSVVDLTDPLADPDASPTPTPSAPASTVPVAPTAAAPVDPETLVWPRMDVDATLDKPLLDGTWVAPAGAAILLSGFTPAFVVLTSEDGSTADAIGRSWVESLSDNASPKVDTVEDLNEISTTYTAVSSKKGLSATATYVQSGRGNYAVLSFVPAAG